MRFACGFLVYRKKKMRERKKEREIYIYISSFSKLRALLCNRHFACFTFSLMAAFTYLLVLAKRNIERNDNFVLRR